MLKKSRIYFAFFVLSLCTISSYSQIKEEVPATWQIKPVISQGFILIHRASIGHLVKGYPTTYEVNFSKVTSGSKLWHLENNLPDIGITAQCIDFKNPEQLGYALTASPYAEVPLNKKNKASRVIMRLCLGATYLTKRFDIKEDPKNVAIGSHLNCFVQLRWMWRLKLSERFRLEPGLSFTHASNAKARNPNLGLNVVSVNLGLNYLLSSPSKKTFSSIDSSTRVKSKHEILTYAAAGFNQHKINGPILSCYLYSLAYQYNVSNRHKFSAGTDFFYDQNYFIDYKNLTGEDPSGADKLRVSFRLGYSYNMGRISFPVEVGYYVFEKVVPDASVVSRIGIRYYSPSGIVLNFGLRTHYAVAYNLEYGIGYRFALK